MTLAGARLESGSEADPQRWQLEVWWAVVTSVVIVSLLVARGCYKVKLPPSFALWFRSTASDDADSSFCGCLLVIGTEMDYISLQSPLPVAGLGSAGWDAPENEQVVW